MHMQDHNRSKAVAGLEFCNSTPESLRFRGHSQSIAISNPPQQLTCWAWHLTMPHRGLFDSEAQYLLPSSHVGPGILRCHIGVSSTPRPNTGKTVVESQGQASATPYPLFSPCQIHQYIYFLAPLQILSDSWPKRLLLPLLGCLPGTRPCHHILPLPV